MLALWPDSTLELSSSVEANSLAMLEDGGSNRHSEAYLGGPLGVGLGVSSVVRSIEACGTIYRCSILSGTESTKLGLAGMLTGAFARLSLRSAFDILGFLPKVVVVVSGSWIAALGSLCSISATMRSKM